MASIGRTRTRGGSTVTDQIGKFVNQTPYSYSESPFNFTHTLSSEVTEDEVHTNYPFEGGPFSSRKATVTYNDFVGKAGSYRENYRGIYQTIYDGLYRMPSPANPTLPLSNVAECESYGAQAWSRFKPAKPDVSLSIAIAELKDVPSLMFKRLNKFRNYGNNYLAVEFGWKPFLSDIRRWLNSIKEVDRRVAQLSRDNGRRIRRGGKLFSNEETNTAVETIVRFQPSNYCQFISGSLSTTTKSSCWFKGSFRYYIPGLNSGKWGKFKAIRHIWDLEIGPEQVYELIPYSWLVDWFSNLGDVVGNYASSFEDNLVADYAYVMLHNVQSLTRTNVFNRIWTENNVSSFLKTTVSSTLDSDTKSRVAANPFGFSWDFSGITARQAAILAALGISRLKF